ncbi:MAG TPA: hypothetical protein VGN72_09670 [Tepidisphaeraceae bacterium]|jgi:hypothetical protein|nr:hypothetical protein [Tepidisphaeraceae bacterium]
MPVTDVAERFDRRRSSIKDGKVSHTRTWLVTCDAITDGTAAALTASAGGVTIPRYGDRLFPANAFNRRLFALMVKAFDANHASDAQELADVMPDNL